MRRRTSAIWVASRPTCSSRPRQRTPAIGGCGAAGLHQDAGVDAVLLDDGERVGIGVAQPVDGLARQCRDLQQREVVDGRDVWVAVGAERQAVVDELHVGLGEAAGEHELPHVRVAVADEVREQVPCTYTCSCSTASIAGKAPGALRTACSRRRARIGPELCPERAPPKSVSARHPSPTSNGP